MPENINYALPERPTQYGWLVKPVQCPMCNHKWVEVAPVGAKGIQCTKCLHADPEYVWQVGEDMPARG